MQQVSRHRRPFALAVVALVASAGALVGGCATPIETSAGAILPPTALAPVDHAALAASYERQASVDAEQAQRHLRYAAIYRKNPADHEALARRCEALARTYQQASAENAALAAAHRQLAGGNR